jgi:hypothetical protein
MALVVSPPSAGALEILRQLTCSNASIRQSGFSLIAAEVV